MGLTNKHNFLKNKQQYVGVF